MKLLNSTGLHWLWIAIIILIIDLGSKFLILQNFSLEETVSLFPLFNLHYTRNYGAAFNFLSNEIDWNSLFFSGIAIGVCIVLLIAMYHSKPPQKLNNISYALIIGGALGNLFDRLWNGFVVDMIDFYISDWHFATFNFADCTIFVGSILIILERFLLKSTEKK